MTKKITKNYYKNHKVHQKNTKTNLEIGLDYVLSVTLFRKNNRSEKKCFKRTKVKKSTKYVIPLDIKKFKIPN